MNDRFSLALALAALLAPAAAGQTVANSRFESGLLGWTVTPTSASAVGAPGAVGTLDGPGPDVASEAAAFAVGKVPGTPGPDYHGVIVSQDVVLYGGIDYAFRIDWSVENAGGVTANGGRFRLRIDGEVNETLLVGGVPAGGLRSGVLAAGFTADETMLATIEIVIDSPATPASPATLWQRIDDVRLESGFRSEPGFLSIAGGGIETMEIDVGPAYGGQVYRVLGSVTGEVPGIDLPGDVHLPLVHDGYLLATLQAPAAPFFGGFAGVLDADGRASASFQIPAGLDPALVGLTLWHAVATIPTGGGPVSFGSNADSLAFF
jgi:hypothetical protein